MSRPKGMPKTGGRAKGTPNKVTNSLREWIASIIDKNKEQIESDLEELEPKERLQIILKLIDYVIPKAQAEDEDESHPETVNLIQESIRLLNSNKGNRIGGYNERLSK